MSPLGVLVLHGFTGSLKTVNGIIPFLKRARLPYEMPVLRGHGTRPEDLENVTYHDWVEDAEVALERLLARAKRVVVVGLSMGALVALELGIRHPSRVAGVVAVAPALRFTSPLAPFAPYLSRVIRYFPMTSSFTDAACAKGNDNYPRFPVRAFVSLYRFSERVESRLMYLNAPLLILQHRKNQVTNPRGAEIIYKKAATSVKDIHWFEKTGHDMMQDCEREAVFREIIAFIEGLS